jgi:dihydroorotate dehydrogenase
LYFNPTIKNFATIRDVKDFFIAAPFGNYITHKKCTSVCGTFTFNKRGNTLSRLYRSITTIRPIKGGWINNIGFQNPGIKSIKKFKTEKVYSIAAIKLEDWDEFLKIIPANIKLELNLSCPNIGQETKISNEQIKAYLEKYSTVIFKLPPIDEVYNQIDNLINLGSKYLHIANTIPIERGGESGGRLKLLSLEIIKEIRAKYPNVKIIGGGGIYSKEDVKLYKNAGADYFSLATILFRPWKAIKLLKNF